MRKVRGAIRAIRALAGFAGLALTQSKKQPQAFDSSRLARLAQDDTAAMGGVRAIPP
jgi:hypothetical protein